MFTSKYVTVSLKGMGDYKTKSKTESQRGGMIRAAVVRVTKVAWTHQKGPGPVLGKGQAGKALEP